MIMSYYYTANESKKMLQLISPDESIGVMHNVRLMGPFVSPWKLLPFLFSTTTVLTEIKLIQGQETLASLVSCSVPRNLRLCLVPMKPKKKVRKVIYKFFFSCLVIHKKFK